jgi:peptidyl-prolyl cis-trans isomerase B (cyclophilin B)
VDSTKRARQKANRAKKLETIQKQERRDRRVQYLLIVALAVAGLVGVLYLLSISGDDDTATTDTTAASSEGSTATTAEPAADGPAISAPKPGATSTGTPECPAEDGSSERTTSFAQAPPTCIDETASYEAVVETTLGPITLTLDPAAAPLSVNNFVFLARYHYYDGTPFHRIISGFVVQGGDASHPDGDPAPGYTIAEEPPPAEGAGPFYEIGSLAMAKTPAPNSTSSQFFIVSGSNGASLPPEYSLFGEVSDGLDVVEAIQAIPTNAEDQPLEPIYIESVTINQS